MNFELPESVKFWSQFLHPILMWVLLAVTIYNLYLGIKIRQTRTAEGEEKKELVRGRFNIKHYQVGSLLLVFLVFGALGGMAVTYINNEKLFLGPHLLVGLSMTGLVAASSSLSPFMQRGNMWARYSHIALNIVLLGLFGWQAVTGTQIVQKILSST
jgi:hypothetical protein